MAGYIKLWRGWRDTDGLTPSTVYSDWEAWLWLLENATWKETSRWNKKGEEIILQPGQIHVSLRSLSTAWGWSKSKVERFLGRLERVKKAGQQTGQSGIVLTIENWDKYQSTETATGTASETAAGQPRDTQEEGKEGKKEEDHNYRFSGRVIKLTTGDFAKWEASYSALDLMASLQSRDDWLAEEAPPEQRKKWFTSTSNWLASKQQQATSTKEAPGEKRAVDAFWG
jgi:hypothetical protein